MRQRQRPLKFARQIMARGSPTTVRTPFASQPASTAAPPDSTSRPRCSARSAAPGCWFGKKPTGNDADISSRFSNASTSRSPSPGHLERKAAGGLVTQDDLPLAGGQHHLARGRAGWMVMVFHAGDAGTRCRSVAVAVRRCCRAAPRARLKRSRRAPSAVARSGRRTATMRSRIDRRAAAPNRLPRTAPECG